MACQFIMPGRVFMGAGALELSMNVLKNLGKKGFGCY